jgi:hypothetical protein
MTDVATAAALLLASAARTTAVDHRQSPSSLGDHLGTGTAFTY